MKEKELPDLKTLYTKDFNFGLEIILSIFHLSKDNIKKISDEYRLFCCCLRYLLYLIEKEKIIRLYEWELDSLIILFIHLQKIFNFDINFHQDNSISWKAIQIGSIYQVILKYSFLINQICNFPLKISSYWKYYNGKHWLTIYNYIKKNINDKDKIINQLFHENIHLFKNLKEIILTNYNKNFFINQKKKIPKKIHSSPLKITSNNIYTILNHNELL